MCGGLAADVQLMCGSNAAVVWRSCGGHATDMANVQLTCGRMLTVLTKVWIRLNFIIKALLTVLIEHRRGKVFDQNDAVDCVDRRSDKIGFYNKSSC